MLKYGNFSQIDGESNVKYRLSGFIASFIFINQANAMEYTIMQQIPVAINAALTHCNYLSAGNDENSDFSTTSPLNQKQKNLPLIPKAP